MSKGKKKVEEVFKINGTEITDPAVIELLKHEKKFPYHSERYNPAKGKKRYKNGITKPIPKGYSPISLEELVNVVSKDLALIPTDNFEALKANRQAKIESDLKSVIDRCPADQPLSKQDLVILRLARLNGEFKHINGWLANETPSGKTGRVPVLTQLSVLKYKAFIQSEINRIGGNATFKDTPTIIQKAKKPQEFKTLKEILLFDPDILKVELEAHGYFKGGSFVGNNDSNKFKAGGKTGAGIDFVALCIYLCKHKHFGSLSMKNDKGQIKGAMMKYFNYSIDSYWDRWNTIPPERVQKFDFLRQGKDLNAQTTKV